MSQPLLEGTSQQYAKWIAAYGPTSLGIGWTKPESQVQLFKRLIAILPTGEWYINDLGCGYGALLDHLPAHAGYSGYDICKPALELAQQLHPDNKFHHADHCLYPADYSLASGTFDVRCGVPTEQWEVLIRVSLRDMDAKSWRGFGFNLRRKREAEKPLTYEADPKQWSKFCEQFGDVELVIDDAPQYFTILVRK